MTGFGLPCVIDESERITQIFGPTNFVHHKIPDLSEHEHEKIDERRRKNDRLSETAIKSWLMLPPRSPRALGFYALIIEGSDMVRSRRNDYENRTLERNFVENF